MKYFILILYLILTCPIYSQIRTFPSGIKVDFEAKKKGKRSEYLIQDKKNLLNKTKISSKFIRIIDGLSDLPKKYYIGIVFYNEDDKVLKYIKIKKIKKPSPKEIFFMDRNSGKKFQGTKDIYYLPKKTISFTIAILDKKGKIYSSLSHPNFDANNKLQLNKWLKTSPNKPVMLQFEVSGTFKNPSLRIGAFNFV